MIGISQLDDWTLVKKLSRRFRWRFRGIFSGNPFCHTFFHTNMIVKKSLKFRQRFRCFNSSLTKFQQKFGWKFDDFVLAKILWQNEETFRQNARGDILPCGKTFCHKKNVFLSSKISLLQLELQRNSDERICGKILRQNVLPQTPDESLTKFWRKENEGTNERNLFTRTYCKC